AHDAENKHKVGDQVRIRECRPLSKLKRLEVVGEDGASA
ncbi:MAG: 30S ribosomal protein S17, partial [Pseudomonadota bacterium]